MLYVGSEPEYQLMHNTQGAARSAPHVDTHVHVHGGAPVEICGNPAPRSSLAACQLPICPERRVSLPFTDEGRLHANLERPDSASRFVRLVQQYVVSLGRSSGPARHRAAQQQRDREPGVHEAGEQADPCQATG